WIDRKRPTRMRDGTRPITCGCVHLGSVFERVEHALLPRRAFQVEPIVPVGGIAEIETFEERSAPELDGSVQVRPRCAGSRELLKGGDIGPDLFSGCRAPDQRVADRHDWHLPEA